VGRLAIQENAAFRLRPAGRLGHPRFANEKLDLACRRP
jgi:hypothetical protein